MMIDKKTIEEDKTKKEEDNEFINKLNNFIDEHPNISLFIASFMAILIMIFCAIIGIQVAVWFVKWFGWVAIIVIIALFFAGWITIANL